MDDRIEISIPVEPQAAAALTDARTREAVGHIVSRMVRSSGGEDSPSSRDSAP